MRDLTYPAIILTARVGFRALGIRFQISGAEHVPREGGAVIAFNHISYADFIFGGYAAVPADRLVRFMAKREIFDHRLAGPLMRSMHHIRVDRADGIGSYDEAVGYLRAGEVVGMFPEATISRSFELKTFKTGAVRMAAQAAVPLVPAVLWGTQRIITKDHPRDLSRGKTLAVTVGAPMHPDGTDPAAQTAALKAEMTALLATTIAASPAAEQPPGSWWRPAAYGGSAPTPAEAAVLEDAERERRLRRRRAQ